MNSFKDGEIIHMGVRAYVSGCVRECFVCIQPYVRVCTTTFVYVNKCMLLNMVARLYI